MPKIHKFKYNVFKIFFDLETIDEFTKTHIFFSLNRFNLFSFYYKDHLNKENKNPFYEAKKIFLKNNLYDKGDKIFILCYPRILGYVFNPISIFLCISKSNKNIKSILYEVNNTFGDKHYYLGKYNPKIKDKTKKVFHVSPFFNIKGEYEFSSVINKNSIKIEINYFNNNKNKKIHMLNAIFYGKQEEFTDIKLLINFFKFPFMTLKVIIAIHINALKLWFKGIKFFSRPKPPRNILSLNKSLRKKE